MALDAQADIPISVIAALVRSAVRYAFGDDCLLGIYEDPRDLRTLAAGKLPAMSIYRKKEKRFFRNSVAYNQIITVALDYVLPSTSLERRSGRWPALQAVWNLAADVIAEGRHVSINGGADVFVRAGMWMNDNNSPDVEYSFADESSQAYPFFRGTMLIEFTPSEVDVNSIDDFLLNHASFDIGGTNDVPEAEDETALPPFGS